MSAYEVTFLNVTNISFHPHSAFFSFPLSPLTLLGRGWGARQLEKRSAGLSDSGDRQRPRAAADRKAMKGQRQRASRCLQLQGLCTVPPPAASGSRLGLGAARCRGGQAGAGGRAGPHHGCSTPSSFVQGTDHRKTAGWCWRWEFGSLWGRWEADFTGASYKTSPYNRD